MFTYSIHAEKGGGPFFQWYCNSVAINLIHVKMFHTAIWIATEALQEYKKARIFCETFWGRISTLQVGHFSPVLWHTMVSWLSIAEVVFHIIVQVVMAANTQHTQAVTQVTKWPLRLCWVDLWANDLDLCQQKLENEWQQFRSFNHFWKQTLLLSDSSTLQSETWR